MAESSCIGLDVGDINKAIPACADDIILMANDQHNMQCQLNLSYLYANQERYTIHPQKSVVTTCEVEKEWRKILTQETVFSLGDDTMPMVTKYTHLGIDRFSGTKSNTELLNEKIKLGRKTMYALMGVWAHGSNGLPVLVTIQLYTVFVVLRIQCGLESLNLSKTDIEALEKFHRDTLRMLQNLPVRFAKEAVYLLCGSLPIQALIDLRRLSLFGAIARKKFSKILELAQRQLIMKDENSHSLFIPTKNIIFKYDLGHPLEILQGNATKESCGNIHMVEGTMQN